jgi:hypothetical protein
LQDKILGKNLKKITGKEFCEVRRAGAHFANRDHCQHAMCNCNICRAVGARDGADMSGRNGRHYKEGRTSMCTLASNTEIRMLAGGIVGLLCAGAAVWPALAAEGTGTAASVPIFAPDGATAWVPDRPAGDDFLPPARGPGPVISVKDRPYVPNGVGRQPTYRVADLVNPILKPWAIEQMKKANDEVIAGKVPFITRERCWPAGVPGFTVYTRVEPIYFLQTPKEVVIVNELNAQLRHIYLNVPHSAQVTPSWYGESVGRYEGDELVVDTIGLNDKTFVDNYRTPHTNRIHVVERFKMIEGGKTLQSVVTVDDPGAFNMAWSATQRWRRVSDRPMTESICAENNYSFFDYEVVPIPQAGKPDF